jgi:hypothetical protein
MAPPRFPQVPKGVPWDPQALLGPDLAARGGGRVMAEMARVGQLGDYALQQQGIADAAVQSTQRFALGMGGPTSTPSGGIGSLLPPGFSNEVDGSFQLPRQFRLQLERNNIDPDVIEATVNRNLLTRAGADYQQRLLYGQNAAASPDELQAKKEQMFSSVARALEATPERKDAIMAAAFSGPNSDRLLAEFDAHMAKQVHEGGQSAWDQITGRLGKVGQGALTSFGQMMAGLGGPADVVRSTLGVLVGARQEGGRPTTGADVLREISELPKDVFNVLSLGTAGLTQPGLRSTSAAPSIQRIAETMRTKGRGDEIASMLLGPLGAVRAAQQVDHPAMRPVESVLGFLGDVSLDPTTYLTLGFGGLGTNATRAAGNAASRAKFLKHLGMDDLIPTMTSADEATWRVLVQDLAGEVGDAAVASADDAANAFRVSAESAHGAQGWAGYRSLLESQGLDADALFPRGILGTGLEAKRAARMSQVRGGVGLRGGLGVGRYQVRGYLNLKPGTGASRGIKPLGNWFTKDGNRFHQLASTTLDNVADVFNYGADGGDRAWQHQNRGLYNATMQHMTLGRGVQHRFEELRRQVREGAERTKKWMAKDPEHATRFTDIIEKGERSDYWELVPPEIRSEAELLWRLKDQGRDFGLAERVDIPMLREIADDPDQMLRHFPHRVIQGLSESVGFPVSPTQVGAGKARTVRAGTQITGPQGTTAMLTEGSYAEIQDVTQRILGEGILQTDPYKVVDAYLGSVGQAAALTKTYRGLAESGLLVPDVTNLAPGAMRAGADNVRAIWATPQDKADQAKEVAAKAVGKVTEATSKILRERAIGVERKNELEHELAMYASRQADADSKISALRKSKAEIIEMRTMAAADHARNLREATAMHDAARRAVTYSLKTELRGVADAKTIVARRLKDLDRQFQAQKAEMDRALAAQNEVLEATPEQVGRALRADIDRLGREAVGGSRPYHQVRMELTATRHRLAQVEAGEIVAGKGKLVIKRAVQTTKGRREQVLGRQRKAGAEAADLNEAIGEAERAVKQAVKDNDPAAETVYRGQLTQLMAQRAEVLQAAERATAEAAELWDLVDAGEAAMRMADLREAEVAAHQAGATIDTQVGRMGPSLQAKMSRLLADHAADMVAEQNRILAHAPRLKFLLKAMREFSVIDTSIPAIPTQGTGRALADYTQEFLARVERRGGDMRGAWDAAVGDPTKAFEAAREEYLREQSALLAREIDLTRQVKEAAQLDPQAKALSTHQVEGDELNLFQAELHRHEKELEWWMNNRDEVRKTQTLKSLQLGALVADDARLAKQLGAAQRLADTDPQAAATAFTEVMANPEIFNLLAPELEHFTIVVGKLPFMEGGAAMPAEIGRVAERLFTHRGDSHNNFLKVMNFFNTRWKRTVLAAPGSVFRRWIGNVYNAVVLAGVSPGAFVKAYQAMGWRMNKLDPSQIGDEKLRYYMELADEWNIFEGQFSALGTETEAFKQGGLRHPIHGAQKILQTAAMRGEDIARLAQFIDGLDSGMGPHAARMWTGKYHFFNNELTQAERDVLRPLYPFYAYLRNNYALQFYTLFHQPGKIALYGTAMRDFSAQPEGTTAPDFVEQSGGFPVSGDHWLQNTLLDTSPLGLPQTILGLRAQGQPNLLAGLQGGELAGTASPLLQGAAKVGLGINPETGEKLYPKELGPSAMPFTSALQALGLVNDQGKWNPRQLAAIESLIPQGMAAKRLLGVAGLPLTASQAEQVGPTRVGFFGGPNFWTQTPTSAGFDYADRKQIIDAMLASVRATRGEEAVPTTAELTDRERTRRAIEQLMATR